MAFGFGRIEFDGNFIDLARPWSDFQPNRFTQKGELDSGSGITETLKGYSKWFINARLNLLDPQEKAQLQRLFEYAEDGSSFTLIRDRNLGAHIPFEGGINPTAAPRGLKTNDDVDGTFTRTDVADSAWYLNEGTGLLTLRDGTDVPRFPAGKYGAGVQIDGAAVNLITHPSAPDNAAWNKTNCTAAATTETLDPAGASNAQKITGTGVSPELLFASGTAVGNDVAEGVWLKVPSGTLAVNLTLSGTGGGNESEAITITSEWQPFSNVADTSGFTTNLEFIIDGFDDTDVFYIWGAGMFDSFEFYPGTVGALSTSSITRNAEKLTFPSANIVNRDKMSALMWVSPNFDPTSDTTTRIFFESGDSVGAIGDLHVDFFFETGDRLSLDVRGDNENTKRIDYTPAVATGMTQNNLHLIGFTVDARVSNGGHVFVDGAELSAGSSNNAFNVSEPGDTFALGSKIDGTLQAFSVIDEVLITQNVLTAADFAEIFNLGIGLGVPRNRWTVQLNDQVWNPRWLGSDIYDIPLLLKEVLT